jgi:hypothetical protein
MNESAAAQGGSGIDLLKDFSEARARAIAGIDDAVTLYGKRCTASGTRDLPSS